jgi:hypothetical protein
MKKKALITIGAAASAIYLGASIARVIRARKRFRKDFVETLVSKKNDLELYVNLIDSAAKEVPEEKVHEADRLFAETVDEAVEFANTVFMPYCTLEEDDIAKFSEETIRAYLECIGSSTKTAMKFYEKIEIARKRMIRAHEGDKKED